MAKPQTPSIRSYVGADRQSLIAQAQIQSIRTSLDIQEENASGISSLKQLFENVAPGFPLVVTREKFIHLYFQA